MNKFGARSLLMLNSARAELIIAATETLHMLERDNLDMTVFEGLRTRRQQAINIEKGVSWTMESYHLSDEEGLSRALDLVPYLEGKVRWDDSDVDLQHKIDECFDRIAAGMRESCERHGFQIDWGYKLWGKDKPHFQLNA